MGVARSANESVAFHSADLLAKRALIWINATRRTTPGIPPHALGNKIREHALASGLI